MEVSPAKFLALFLFLSGVGWLLFTFTARLVAWILSRMIKGDVRFRVGGLNSLKDVSLNLKQGPLELLVIGEVRFRTCRPSADSFNRISSRTRLQILLCDAEVVLRKETGESFKSSKRGSRHKKQPSGRGKWMVLCNIAQYVTVSVLELMVQVPDWVVEVKELELVVNCTDSRFSCLDVSLISGACNVYERENSEICCTSNVRERHGSHGGNADGASALLSLEHFFINSTFGHVRDQGVKINQLDANCGVVLVNVSEVFFQYKVGSSEGGRNVEAIESSIAKDKRDIEIISASKVKEEKSQDALLKFLPEKASFNLPKLLIKCRITEKHLVLENEVCGIHLSCSRLQNEEESKSLSHLDVHMEASEIQVLREGDKSLLEVMKLAVSTSLEIHKHQNSFMQAEVDMKLGGVQCNLLTAKFERWLDLLYIIKNKKKRSVSSSKGKSQKMKLIWTLTISAPDMAASLYDLNGIVLYHICLQTSHVLFTSAFEEGARICTELGELHIYLVEEEHAQYKGLFGMDTNPGCLLQLSHVTVDWGLTELSTTIKNGFDQKNVSLLIEVIGTAIHLTMSRVQSILSSCMRFASHFKSLNAAKYTSTPSKGSTAKRLNSGSRMKQTKIFFDGILIQFCEHLHLVTMEVPDPKKVNFGSQGGEILVEKREDGSPRVATVKVATFCGIKGSGLVCKLNLEVTNLQLHFDREKGDTQVDVQKLRTAYQELSLQMKPITDITVAALQSGKIVYRTAFVGNGVPGCLIRAVDFKGRWEPDIQLCFLDAFLRLKTFIQKQRQSLHMEKKLSKEGLEYTSNASHHTESSTKGQSLAVAVDIEHVEFSAALADGVEGFLSIGYVFSEDFKVGILLEDMKVALNGATVVRGKSLQAARLPASLQTTTKIFPGGECSNCGAETSSTSWDYLIQASAVLIILPYRLECRAIDDAVEDTWRGLKLAMAAQRISILGTTTMPNVKSKKKAGSLRSSIGAIKLVFDSLTGEIEEEPIQGWFDEHHQMISQQRLELDVRERLLDEFMPEGRKLSGSHLSSSDLKQLKIWNLDKLLEGKEASLSNLKEVLQHQAFQSYHKACQNLRTYEASGSSRGTLQSGFKPSVNRGSLLSVEATGLEVMLLDIEGGITGMIEQIRKLDCIPPDIDIPYSRVLGKNVKITTATLTVQLRNYSLPMLAAKNGRCDGHLIFARQATRFAKQVPQDIYIGRWRKLTMLRSESGTTPPFKMFSELPIEFDKAEVAYGVGFEPSFTDLSYAFTVALRKAELSVHDLVEHIQALPSTDLYLLRASAVKPLNNVPQPVKKERSLPWWDDMRYYLHGKNSIASANFKWAFLATTNPYEKRDMMKIDAGFMDIQQQEGKLSFFAKDFNLSISSLEGATAYQDPKQFSSKLGLSCIQSPFFQLDITMIWDCETGKPLFHYLHTLPHDLVLPEKLYDPFRSTSLILRLNFCLGEPSVAENAMETVAEMARSFKSYQSRRLQKSPAHKMSTEMELPSVCLKSESYEIPIMNLGGHDLIWIFKWWSTFYSPPHKLRTFSKWPRFGLPRFGRSGNLSFDKVLTDFMLRVDASPVQIRHTSVGTDDPAEGLTFDMKRLKYELCFSRGKQRYSFDSKRDILELVYQGLDLHALKANLKRDLALGAKDKSKAINTTNCEAIPQTANSSQFLSKSSESGFFFTTDYFSLRRQAPKADLTRLSSWQQESRTVPRASSSGNAVGSGSDPARSDPSDDDGFNIVRPDNCLRVSLYSLKLLWTITNRDAVWAWVEDIYRAFESPRPSPSRQYAQRKFIEEQTKLSRGSVDISGTSAQCNKGSSASSSPSPSPSPSHQQQGKSFLQSSPSRKAVDSTPGNEDELDEVEEEGTMHFMVNVVQPQFNLHSEDARGRFLLAAASGRVLARSFHSIMHVRPEMIAQALRPGGDHLPELTWNRRELSVILEQVQAHVAPTDVDPGAGLQWLPKIPRGSPKVKRTGALLEHVFMPCAMYFRYTRCKSDTADLKVKPLKELSFNSSNIIASMTSRQFQVIVDIISNLLLARLPKPRRNTSLLGEGEEGDIEEETDEVVPDGLPEVELARMRLEECERELGLLSNDIKKIKQGSFTIGGVEEVTGDEKQELWMMFCGKPTLELKLMDNLRRQRKVRKMAAVSLRHALRRAAQQRFKEKEKSKSSPSAMRISWAIDKIAWSMIADGQAFAEAEISNLNLNVDRDFHEVGVAQFAVKHFVVKNCLPNAKSSTVLSAWNPPIEWTRNVMLRVDARQGAPRDGHSPLELFEVEIYPLKIYLTETMYRMMWGYFFPEENQDSQRQQVWKASTTAVVKRGKKVTSSSTEVPITSTSKGDHIISKTHTSTLAFLPTAVQLGEHQGIDFRLAAHLLEKDIKFASARDKTVSGHRRTSSLDRSLDLQFPETLTMDIVPKLDANPSVSSSKSCNCIQLDDEDGTRHVLGATNESTTLRQRDSGRTNKSYKSSVQEDKKGVKAILQDEKKSSRLQHTYLEFHNIKISQVELLVTYEGSRLTVNDVRLLMDTFTRIEFTGTWRRLFSRVKKHIIWGVLKSVAGMQEKKFKDKLPPGQGEGGGYPADDSSSSDSDDSNIGTYEQFFISKYKRRSDRAGEGFVSSIRGLFNSQRRKAKGVILRNMPADGSEENRGVWTESEADTAPFTRQLSISKAKRLLRRHTKKFLSSTRHRGAILFKEPAQGSPSFQSEPSSDASSCYEDFND